MMPPAFAEYSKGDKVQLGTKATEYTVQRVYNRHMVLMSDFGMSFKAFPSDDVNPSQKES